MPPASLLLFILPLGLDTLGVSISLGIKSYSREHAGSGSRSLEIPTWLRSALLFSLAEMLMPLVGLVIGFAAAALIGNLMHFIGPLLLIGVGLWELFEEGREYVSKWRKSRQASIQSKPARKERPQWGSQLLLALSISLDELAIGFSFGAIANGASGNRMVNPLILCALIGVQGFLMTITGLLLGRTLRNLLKPVKELSEILSAFLLVALGIWFLFT
ncbi:MAG TPA: manganese efflux pump [Ktedonobacteraceae bacterium]|nr:manganese efflux pump [Ktedonobacteraceae bacterium]